MRLTIWSISLLTISLLLTSCHRQANSMQETPSARIEFLGETEYDFGPYSTRDTVYHYFVYKNVGTVPFVIDKVEPSCYCVRPVYSKKPLQPGGVDSIRMAYDGNGFTPGYFIKRCDIYSNADTVYQIRIKGRYFDKI